MARVNIYLPDALPDEARGANLNISRLTQHAIRRALRQSGVAEWVAAVSRLPKARVNRTTVQEAVDAALDELGTARE